MDKNTQIYIQEISRLMNYDRSKTLLEQSEFAMDRRYGISKRNARALNMTDAEYEKEVVNKGGEQLADFISEYRHEILDVLSIGSLFIPIVGPFISLGIDIGNAALYYNEGDKEIAGLVLALSIIPGGEILKRFPSVKKYGVEFITKALSKTKAGAPMTAFEQKAIREFTEQSANGTLDKAAKRAFRSTFAHAVKKKLSTLSLPQKIGVLYNYAMTYPGTKLASVLIQVGGISLTYFKLAKYFGFTNEPSNEEMMKKISEEWNNDEQLQKDIVDSLLKMDDKQASEAFGKFFETPTGDSNKPETQKSEGGSKSIPQNIIEGVMKKGYLIRKGIHNQESKYPGMMKSIEFIQKLVGAKVDGKFGPETESKVKEWQKSNGLKDDGIVGKNTLNKILENS
jgi:peptidoglycan hydrolase-like protein with peptidoglycan-binding domain